MKKEVALPAPLFRDPIYDCPTDPTIIWNREEKQWYLFYTQRRAADTSTGVSWVHGTKIGIAVSKDGGKWLYRGTLEGLDIEKGHNTFWRRKSCGRKAVTICMYLILPVSLLIGNIPGRCCIIPRTICGTGNFRGE